MSALSNKSRENFEKQKDLFWLPRKITFMQITLLTATLFPLSLRNYAKQTTTLTRCCALFLVSIPPSYLKCLPVLLENVLTGNLTDFYGDCSSFLFLFATTRAKHCTHQRSTACYNGMNQIYTVAVSCHLKFVQITSKFKFVCFKLPCHSERKCYIPFKGERCHLRRWNQLSKRSSPWAPNVEQSSVTKCNLLWRTLDA